MRRVFLAVVILVAGHAWVQAGDLPRELVNAYRPALEAIRQAYVHGTFRGKTFVELPGQEKFKRQDFVMRAAGDKRRVDLTTTQQKNLNLPIGKRDMFMATPIGSLTTSANPGSKVFDSARQLKHATATATIENSVLLKYPYAIKGDTPILDMLLSPSVKVTDVKRVKSVWPDPGQHLVPGNVPAPGPHRPLGFDARPGAQPRLGPTGVLADQRIGLGQDHAPGQPVVRRRRRRSAGGVDRSRNVARRQRQVRAPRARGRERLRSDRALRRQLHQFCVLNASAGTG